MASIYVGKGSFKSIGKVLFNTNLNVPAIKVPGYVILYDELSSESILIDHILLIDRWVIADVGARWRRFINNGDGIVWKNNTQNSLKYSAKAFISVQYCKKINHIASRFDGLSAS